MANVYPLPTRTDLRLEDILSGANVAEYLTEAELSDIGHQVKRGYDEDMASRSEWNDRSVAAMKLALQVVEPKTFPFDKASNVKMPILTIASLQFHAKAYPSLIPGTDVVKMRTYGDDPDGEKAKRADRISQHMSYQILEEDESWEEQMDRLLIALPIEGCEFKKSWFDPVKGHNVSQWVRPEDLVVPYYATCLEDATRITHVLNNIPKRICDNRMRSGFYLDKEIGSPVATSNPQEDARNERQGLNPSTSPDTYTLLEQHTWLDLDGDDYQEPYIVTTDDKGAVLRIFPRFTIDDVEAKATEQGKIEIIKIEPFHHFTKYSMIPSPDGGFYDIGFGHLIGPLNDSASTVLNQLIDAGTLYNLQAGFLGRGARIKGGNNLFQLGEWKNVDSTGDDLKKSVMALPTREPSAVLFNVLGFLVDYANRLGSVTDLMVGESPGQNQPMGTTMAMMEQGMAVFNGIFKRIHRAMKQEFRKLYLLNRTYLQPETYFAIMDTGNTGKVTQTDYQAGDEHDIRPAADPNMASSVQLLAKAQALREAAYNGQGYDVLAVEHRYLEALKIPNIEEVHPTGENAIQPQPDPKMEIEKAKLEQRASEQQMKYQQQMQKLTIAAQKEEAAILLMQAQAQLALSKAEREGHVADLETFKAGMDAAQARRQAALETLKLLKEINSDAMGGMEAAPSDGQAMGVPEGPAQPDAGGMGQWGVPGQGQQ